MARTKDSRPSDKRALGRSGRTKPTANGKKRPAAGRRKQGSTGRLRIGDHWNAITIIALSQNNPLKAIAEFVENSRVSSCWTYPA